MSQRIDTFELWCWIRCLRVPWTARWSKQSIVKEINPEYSVVRLMLKLQYFSHLMRRADSLERPWCWDKFKINGEGDNTGWDGWMASLTLWTWVWASFGRWWWIGKPVLLQSMGFQSQTQLSDLTTSELPPCFYEQDSSYFRSSMLLCCHEAWWHAYIIWHMTRYRMGGVKFTW